MRALMLGVLPLLAACGGPDVTDIVEQEVALTLTAVTSQPDIAAIGEPDGGLGVTRAYVATSAVSLVPCREDAASIVLSARGYDLLSTPPPGEVVTTAVNEWCAIQIDLDPVTTAQAQDLPDGVTLAVEAKDADDTSLLFTSARSKSLRFTSETAAGFPSTTLLLGFDVARWLAGLPLPEPDMTKEEGDLLDSQLATAVELYADLNDNQALDEDETTPLARAAAPR